MALLQMHEQFSHTRWEIADIRFCLFWAYSAIK